MKNTYKTILDLKNVDLGLLIFRIGISGFMLSHGIPKLLNFFNSEELKFADPVGLGDEFTFAFAVFAEFVCSAFILFGFLTRLAVIPLIITMAVAAFIVHSADGFIKQELPLLFLLGFILLAFTGAGKYSVDFRLGRKK